MTYQLIKKEKNERTGATSFYFSDGSRILELYQNKEGNFPTSRYFVLTRMNLDFSRPRNISGKKAEKIHAQLVELAAAQ